MASASFGISSFFRVFMVIIKMQMPLKTYFQGNLKNIFYYLILYLILFLITFILHTIK